MIITTAGDAGVLAFQERPRPMMTADEVLIKVKAAGVNRPDILQRQGKYPAPSGAPADIPGLEVAGIIEDLGKNVTRWQLGDRICALIPGGGYAEYVNAHAGHCLPIPDGCTYVEAASLPETVFTVVHNVFQRGALRPGETLLVQGGSSGIGITAIQLATAFGAHVIATAGSADKCRACLDLGAQKCIDYKQEDFEQVLGPKTVDVILDMVGGDYFNKHIKLLKPEGRLVSINAIDGSDVELNIFALMIKRLTITGSTLRARDAVFKAALTRDVENQVWPVIADKRFMPVVYETYPLKEATQAHLLMESSRHIGKIVLIVDHDSP